MDASRAALGGLVLEMKRLEQEHHRRLCTHRLCFLERDVTEWLQHAPQHVRDAYPTRQLLLRLTEEGLLTPVRGLGNMEELFRLSSALAAGAAAAPLDGLFMQNTNVRVTRWEEADASGGGAGGAGDAAARRALSYDTGGAAAGEKSDKSAGSKHVRFIIEVATSSEQWMTFRRYSEFRGLNGQLGQLFAGASGCLPAMPSKVREGDERAVGDCVGMLSHIRFPGYVLL